LKKPTWESKKINYGQIAQMLIQRTNVALVANGLWYEIETDTTNARTMRLSKQRFCFIPLVTNWRLSQTFIK